MNFSSDHSHFAYILKTNLDYFLSTYVSQLVVLTTSLGEIVIEPSIYEFLHLVGGHYYPKNLWSQNASSFVEAVEKINHEDEKSYEKIGLKNVIEEINNGRPRQKTQYAYDRTIYFKPALRCLAQRTPDNLYIYYRIQSQSNINADYLYLSLHSENDNSQATLPVYLGLLGKREGVYFIIHTLLVDRAHSLERRNFSSVKVTKVRFLSNNEVTKESLKTHRLVTSNYQARRQSQEQQSKKKSVSTFPKAGSKAFLSYLNEALKTTYGRKYSIRRGSTGASSCRLMLNGKKTGIDVSPPKELKSPEEIVKYLMELYEQANAKTPESK